MRPTPPLLILTIGQGLAGGIVLAFAFLKSLGGLSQSTAEALVIMALGTAFIGGVASFFHMHRLAAARYVLRRLKTSWLSREALTTGLFGGSLAILAVLTIFFGRAMMVSPGYWVWTWLCVATGLLAMWVTAMLYATIPAMLSWHGALTVLAFIMVGVLSGFGLAAIVAPLNATVWVAFLVLVVGTAIVKGMHWAHFAEARGKIRASTGTGLPFSPYRLQDTGTTKPPYRTQTQVWPVLSPGLRRTVMLAAAFLLFVVPLGLTLAQLLGGPSLLRFGVAVAAIGGVFLERWLFFGDATHSSRVFLSDEMAALPRVPLNTNRRPTRVP